MSSDNEDDEISNSPSVAGVGGGGKTKSDLDRSRSTTPSSSKKEKVRPGFFPPIFFRLNLKVRQTILLDYKNC